MDDPKTTHALLPLSLLEALQNLDTPHGDGSEEVASELLAKRFGLSETVEAEVERFEELTRRGRAIQASRVTGLFALVGRRADHALVFADAGRRAARRAVRAHHMARLLTKIPGPTAWRRRAGHRILARVMSRSFSATLHRQSASTVVRVAAPLSIQAVADGRACAFYSAAFAELFRLVTGEEVAVQHVRCGGRSDARCEWMINPSSAVLQ